MKYYRYQYAYIRNSEDADSLMSRHFCSKSDLCKRDIHTDNRVEWNGLYTLYGERPLQSNSNSKYHSDHC